MTEHEYVYYGDLKLKYMIILLSEYGRWTEDCTDRDPEDPYPIATDKRVINLWREVRNMPRDFFTSDKELHTYVATKLTEFGYPYADPRVFCDDLREEFVLVGMKYAVDTDCDFGERLLVYKPIEWYEAK